MIIGLSDTSATVTVNTVAISAATFPPPVVASQQYWGTIYYVWYGHWRHWDERGHSPPSSWASMFLPDDGGGVYSAQNLYNSMDISILNRHLTEMDRAKLDFALASWWGQNNPTDDAFRLLLQQASSNSTLKVKLGIYYEPEANSNPSVSQIVSDLSYIYDQYSTIPAFFKISSGTRQYPVIFVYAGADDNVDYTARWAQARAQMYAIGKPVFIALKVWATATDSFRNHVMDVDNWHQYAPSSSFELQQGYSAFVSPGYWEYPELAISRGRSNPYQPLLARDGRTFANAVKKMAGLSISDAQFLLIETFNEFHEGSMLEPAIPIDHLETGFSQAGPGYGFMYIDIVRDRGSNPLPANNPPSIQPISPRTVNEDSRLTFTVSGSDMDGDILIYTATSLPIGAVFDPSTGTFDWTPSESQGPGDYSVTFTVTDNGSPRLSASITVTIHVLEVNSPPRVEPIKNLNVENGTVISMQINATDMDTPAQTLSFSLEEAPIGALISSNGLFEWNTSDVPAGDYLVRVNVSDGLAVSQGEFHINITKPTLSGGSSNGSKQPPPSTLPPPSSTQAPSPGPMGPFSLKTSILVPAIVILAVVLVLSAMIFSRRRRSVGTG